jgi:hypothetical protein
MLSAPVAPTFKSVRWSRKTAGHVMLSAAKHLLFFIENKTKASSSPRFRMTSCGGFFSSVL